MIVYKNLWIRRKIDHWHCNPNPDKRDKCLHQIFFLLKNKKKISKALKAEAWTVHYE